MKKITILLLSVSLGLCLTGCAFKKEEQKETKDVTTEFHVSDDDVKVADTEEQPQEDQVEFTNCGINGIYSDNGYAIVFFTYNGISYPFYFTDLEFADALSKSSLNSNVSFNLIATPIDKEDGNSAIYNQFINSYNQPNYASKVATVPTLKGSEQKTTYNFTMYQTNKIILLDYAGNVLNDNVTSVADLSEYMKSDEQIETQEESENTSENPTEEESMEMEEEKTE